MKQWKFWPPLPVILIVSFLLAFAFSGSIPKRHVINDEAIELLVAQDLPFDRFYFFAPNYHGGNIVPIESLVPYINAFVGRIFGFHARYVHLVHALCYSLTCYIFFLIPCFCRCFISPAVIF